VIALAACAALLAGLGAVSAGCPGPALSRAELGLRLCGALLLGLGLSSLAFSAGLLALRVAGPQSDLALAALGAGLLAFSRGRGLRLQPAPEQPGATRALPELRLFAALAALLALALFVEHSVRYPDGGWDATAIWNVRARALARLPERFDLALAPEVPHADYPLLVPALIAHAFRTLGNETPAAAVALHGLFAALAVALPAFAAGQARGGAAGLMAALLVLSTPGLLQNAWSQCADVPLAALLAGALAFAQGRALLLAGLCAGLCAWTKNEGALALVALLLAALATEGRRAALSLLLGAAAPLLLLAFFKLRFAPPNDLAEATSAVALAARLTDPRRALDIARAYAGQLWQFESWGLSLPAVALAWAAQLARRARPPVEARLPALCAALLALAYAGVYLASFPSDLPYHLAHSLDRLLLHLWPALVLATVLSVLPARAPAPAAG
jgi:hypothetical protein